MTFDDFAGQVLERVRSDMQSIRHPDGDVHPSLFHYHGGEDLRRMRLPRSAFATRQTKDVLVASVAQATRMTRPLMIASCLPSWVSIVPQRDLTPEEQAALARDEMPEGWPTPSQDPERVEIVIVIAVERGGRAAQWVAEVKRDGRNPPSYGGWDWTDATEIRGLMIDPLREAMR